MKIKNKLRLGFGFLFVVVLFFGAVSLFYINEISESAKIILKNNYETLSFSREMRTVLDESSLPLTGQAKADFETNLVKQEHNVTEPGEGESTAALRKSFSILSTKTSAQQLQTAEHDARAQLRKIELLNMQAIVRKNEKAQASVKKALIFLGLVGTFTFLVLFSFSVNFPGFIANPLRELIDGIKEISQKNYNRQLHFDKKDEFAEVALAFNDMAERLKDWENSNVAVVLSEKQRIETIIEEMQDAIIGLNERGEILFINTVAENILNLNEQKLVGQPVEKFTVNNDLFKTIIESGAQAKPFKIALNGKESYFQLESREIVIPNLVRNVEDPIAVANRSVGRVYVLRNITEFKERDEAKTNFIATISHELKTPISSIKMSLKLLNDERIGDLNEQQHELVDNIKEDSDRLLKITSELLDLSQVETGNIQLNFVSADPMAIVNYALESVKFYAEQKGIQLQVSAQPHLTKVHADIEKTAWILVNFLSNALRYSFDKSKVVINIAEKTNQMVFSVKDFGKGIDEQYQKRLFDRYFQVPTDGQHKVGTGLGLAISKDFIEAQDGKIWVESAIGEGSTFFFSLPVAGKLEMV